MLDAGTVAAALGHLDALRQRAVGEREEAEPSLVTGPIEGDAFFRAIVADARLVEVAATLLDGPVAAFGCTYVVKAARVGLPALWHQDGHPWRAGLGITEAVTLWIALDAADAGNGCLRVVPGSHHQPARRLRPNRAERSIFGCEIDPGYVDAARALDVALAPGDLSAHHPSLVHSSEANRSERPRRALALRYRAVPGG